MLYSPLFPFVIFSPIEFVALFLFNPDLREGRSLSSDNFSNFSAHSSIEIHLDNNSYLPFYNTNMNRKCKTLTLGEKLKILKEIETQQVGAKPNFTKIANDYGVHRTSISRLLKEKETLIKRSEEETQSTSGKR